MTTEIFLEDYPYYAAGRLWRVPSVKITTYEKGEEGISLAEIERIHRAVLNEICGDDNLLSQNELEFLCDATSTTLSELAEELGIHKSALSKWKKGGSVPRNLYSDAIKRFFWFKAFGGDLGSATVELALLRNERQFLRYAHDRAIAESLAERIGRRAA